MGPERLKDDAIVEALCEFRLETEELPEVTIGRLSDLDLWEGCRVCRLPIVNIPANIRQADPLLKYQPILELRENSGPKVIKIGSNVLSVHLVGTRNYIGWNKFSILLRESVSQLFGKVRVHEISRVGLRYINVLTAVRHGLNSARDLRIDIRVCGKTLNNPFNINFITERDPDLIGITRIASPQLVEGQLPNDAAAIVDVDVATINDVKFPAAEPAVEWFESAHEFEKDLFFSLFKKETIKALSEDC